MKDIKMTMLSALALCVLAGTTIAEEPPVTIDGVLVADPVGERSCLSVLVEVPEGTTVSGMRWFNGAATTSFTKILASAGEDVVPPLYDEGVVMLEDVTGLQEAWTEVTFPQAVTSTTGILFITFQYPAWYVPTEGEAPLGVGFVREVGLGRHFVSPDGDSWLQFSGSCRPLLEPVFAAEKGSVLVLGPEPEDEVPEVELPKVFAVGTFPNPFNPQTTIRLSLPNAADCRVKVFDIRGRLVKTLQDGQLEAGIHDLPWRGEDDHGRRSASGVYLVQSALGEKTFTNRLLLLK